jgi:hypothetical protein
LLLVGQNGLIPPSLHFASAMQIRRLDRNSQPGSHRGVITLEFLILLPILVILLLAVVEFGLIMAAAKHVEFASRLGAKLAAEALDLSLVNAPSTSDNLKDRVDQYLNTAGYTDSCQVILEHAVPLVPNTTQPNPLVANCPCNPVIGPIGSLPVGSVRVTVCLEMTGNIPNCLESFGYDITGCVIRQSVVWVYEQP